VYLLAVGKAADAMVQGAIDGLADAPVKGLMVTKQAHTTDKVSSIPWLQVIESSHPVPNSASLAAGAAAIEFIRTVPGNAQLLVLMSGGASSLLEHLIDGLSLDDLRALNEQLLAGGLPIDQMNQVRKTVSSIKGGRLGLYLPDIPVTQLLISDVPGDRLSDIGSGPLAPPQGAAADHPGEQVAALPLSLSDDLVACINAFGVVPPAADDSVWTRIESRVVGSCDIAQAAVVAAAGCDVIQEAGSLHGDVNDIADAIAKALLQNDRAGLRVWGGETHLVLPSEPGQGGRNQHLALAVAKRIDGVPGLSVLCCGTDGSDGPTGDAGGFVTGETIANGSALGLDVNDHLDRCDSGSYLKAVDALVTTGPTGTNVMDLAIAIRST